MKQFEHAISKIAAEVRALTEMPRTRHQEPRESIDTLHARLAMIDYEMCEWAERNLRPFSLMGKR